MNIGIDIGYSHTKAVSGERRAYLASVTGSPEAGRFSLNGASGDVLLLEPRHVLVGDGAVLQSRFADRAEDRGWFRRDVYADLFLAALTEVTEATAVDVVLVTGLPVAYYDDREALAERLAGEHLVHRAKRRAQRFTVRAVRVIPQPFGALLAVALNERGMVVDAELASGTVGVIDVGGKTTNLLSVRRMAEIGRETASVPAGLWDVARAVGRYLDDAAPGLHLRDHEIMAAVQARRVTYFDQVLDLGEVVEDALARLGAQVIDQATQLWNGGGRLQAILVAGGGAHLLGERVRGHFRHARISADPVYANACGYWKLAQRVASHG